MKKARLIYMGSGLAPQQAEIGVLGVIGIEKENDLNGSFVGYRITYENGSERVVYNIVELYIPQKN